MSIETMLRDEIKEELDGLKKIELGTECYKTTIDGVTKLVDRVIEMEKLDASVDDRECSRQLDYNLKLDAAEGERRDRKVKNWLTAAGIAVPTVLTVWGTLKSFKFEETGTVTTIMGRGFVNKLLSKK